MTGRDIMVAVVPWPTRIDGDAGDPERSGMRADGRLAYMLTVEGGDAAAGAQAVSVRRGVTTMTVGPLDADQLRRLGRTSSARPTSMTACWHVSGSPTTRSACARRQSAYAR